jgi:hypothetical protein
MKAATSVAFADAPDDGTEQVDAAPRAKSERVEPGTPLGCNRGQHAGAHHRAEVCATVDQKSPECVVSGDDGVAGTDRPGAARGQIPRVVTASFDAPAAVRAGPA